jgi:hypothetical protein
VNAIRFEHEADNAFGAGALGLLGLWAGTFAAGLVTTVVAAAGWDRLDYATWPDQDPSIGPILTILAVGLAVSFAAACVATARVRGRRGDGKLSRRALRWAGAWAAALAVAACGLWGFAYFRDRANYARTTADLVGTWHLLGPDGTPWEEKTLHADGTYESTWLAGPADERRTYRGTYMVSADGRHIEFREENSPRGAAEPIHWEWNIQFADRDHFREWSRVWHYKATDVYVRKK